MITLTPTIIAMLAASVVFQVIGLSLMPLTKGLTELVPSIGCGIAFLAGLGLMARLLKSGITWVSCSPLWRPLFLCAPSR